MSEPETRVVCNPRLPVGLPEWIQTAIPWCITHDEGAIAEGFVVCRVGIVLEAAVKTDCQISMGGHDHKWWVDT